MLFCASGAMDVNTFRKKLKRNTLPDVSNITFEGMFNEYYFDTLTNIKGDDEKSYTKQQQLLIPTYCFAKVMKPKSLQFAETLNSKNNAINKPETNNDEEQYEYFMNVGLNENFDVNEMERNKLNLVIVLDNSGSMQARFDDDNDIDSQTKRDLPPKCPLCNKFVSRSNSYIAWDNIMNEHIESMCHKSVVNNEEQTRLENIIATEHMSKMDIANQSVITLLSQLNDDDRFSLIVFNDKSTIYQKLQCIKDINLNKLKTEILNIKAGGGTDMELAYKDATNCFHKIFENIKEDISDINKTVVDLKTDEGGDTNEELLQFLQYHNLSKYKNALIEVHIDDLGDLRDLNEEECVDIAKQAKLASDDVIRFVKCVTELRDGKYLQETYVSVSYANRIIFITDAIPNASNSKESLLGMVSANASTQQNKACQLHTTFIGVGIDFNTELVEDIIKVEGGNYYSVHSNEEFLKTMNEEFKFMVTPLVFNFILTLMAEGNQCCIDTVFGSGDDEKAILENGEVMNVKSMFPSQHDANNQVKGGVVVLKLKNYVNGKQNASYNMEIKSKYKDVDGKDYVLENNILFGGGEENLNIKKNEQYFDNSGIRKSILLIRYVQILKLWMNYQNRQANKNQVTQEYKDIFKQFIQYFQSEMELIGDNALKKELKILNQIIL